MTSRSGITEARVWLAPQRHCKQRIPLAEATVTTTEAATTAFATLAAAASSSRVGGARGVPGGALAVRVPVEDVAAGTKMGIKLILFSVYQIYQKMGG